MSNGSNPNDPPVPSGVMKTMKIILEAEGFAQSVTEWQVPEELLRSYAIAYNAGVAALGVEISRAIWEKLIEGGVQNAETWLGPEMIEKAKAKLHSS